MSAITLVAVPDAVTQHRLDEMQSGWFVGDFSPVACRTSLVEVAVKHVAAGSSEALHEQLVATEITAVVSGTVLLCDRVLGPGDVLVIPPRNPATFRALTDAVLVVVKTPSSPADKRVLAHGA